MTFTRNSDYFPKLHNPCRLYNSDAAYFLLGGKLIFYRLDQGRGNGASGAAAAGSRVEGAANWLVKRIF
jgi:hypothetical protein